MNRRKFLAAAGAALAAGCSRTEDAKQKVRLYVSLDRDYAEPIINRFKEETGIETEVAYDTEANKSVGLAARILSEKADPGADVFWNNEIVNTIHLAREGALQAYHADTADDVPVHWRDPGRLWTAFAGRARVIVYNPDRIAGNNPPKTLNEMALPLRTCVAAPTAGTTATHLACLFALMGPAHAKTLLRRLRGAGVNFNLRGNADVAAKVADGEFVVGLTDSDDVLNVRKGGKKLEMIFPTGEQPWDKTLIIPNTVALVRNGPEPEAGKRFIRFLLERRVEQLLAWGASGQIPLRAGLQMPKGLEVPDPNLWAKVDWERATDFRAEAVEFARKELLFG